MFVDMMNYQPAVEGSCAAAAAATACAEDDVIESSRDCAILTINYSTMSSHLQYTYMYIHHQYAAIVGVNTTHSCSGSFVLDI